MRRPMTAKAARPRRAYLTVLLSAWPASLRAAVGITAPLAIGAGVGAPLAGIVAGIGALWASTQELPGPPGKRLNRMVALSLASAAGFVLGEMIALAGLSAWPTAAALAVIAAVNGLLSSSGPVRTLVGLHLLLGAILGRWFVVPWAWWEAPLLMLGGATGVIVMTFVLWLARRRSDPARAVERAAESVAAVLASAGRGPLEPVRRQAVRDLDLAAELVHRGGLHPGSDPSAATAVLSAVVDIAEISVVIHADGHGVPAEYIAAVREIGRGHTELRASPTAARTASLARLEGLLAEGIPTPATIVPPRPPAPTPLPAGYRVRFAAALTAAIFVTALAAGLDHAARSYWLPLAVAFIFKPDLGPIFNRAVARTVGTLGGVIAAAVLGAVFGDRPVVLITSAACFAALMPAAARIHHAWTVFTFTPVVFALLDLAGAGPSLLPVRVLNTAAAAVVVLLAELALAPRTWTHHAETLTAAAESAVLAYQSSAILAGRPERHLLRRTACSAIEGARAAVGHTSGDLGGRARGRHLEARLRAAEKACDEVTISLFHPAGGA
jgi:uncharacterized membrane protein YccC